MPGQPGYGENTGFVASAGINAPWPAGTGPAAAGTTVIPQTAANLNQSSFNEASKQRQYAVGGLGSTTGSTGRSTLGG